MDHDEYVVRDWMANYSLWIPCRHQAMIQLFSVNLDQDTLNPQKESELCIALCVTWNINYSTKTSLLSLVMPMCCRVRHNTTQRSRCDNSTTVITGCDFKFLASLTLLRPPVSCTTIFSSNFRVAKWLLKFQILHKTPSISMKKSDRE